MKQYINRMGFTDGIKPAFNPIAIAKTAIWEGRNIDVDDIGVLRMRNGSKDISTSLGTGAIQGSISAFGGILLVWNKSLYLFKNSNFKLIASNLFAAGDVAMELWTENNEPVVYIHDGEGIWKYDGVVCDLVTPYTPAEGEAVNLLRSSEGTQDSSSGITKSTMAVFKHSLASRMVVAYDNSVFLSAPWKPSYFPANQTFQLPDDGGYITALRILQGCLIIYRDRDIYAFIGNDVTNATSVLKVQDSSVGCISGNSIADVPGIGQVFLGRDNLYALNGVTAIPDQYKAVAIGDDIVPYLRRVMSEKCTATYYNREYMICFYDAKEPEKVFRYKTSKQAWYIDSNPAVKQYIVNGTNLFYTSSVYGKIGHICSDYKTDNDVPIQFFSAFAQERLAQGVAKIKKIFVYINSSETLQHIDVAIVGDGRVTETVELDIAASASSDFIIGESQIGVGRIGRLSEAKIYEGKIRKLDKCTFAQVRLIGITPDEYIGVIGYSIEYVSRDKMKGVKKGVVIHD